MSDRGSLEYEPARTGPTPIGADDPRARPDDDATRIRRAEEPQPRELPVWARELLGTELDHFELLDCIGEGGMGRVFRARDTRLDRLVALKVLNPEFAADPDMRRRFEQEAKAAARLDSPFFAQVYHFGVDKGVCFIAMELVEGSTLRKEIAEQGRLDPGFVLRVGAALAYGLHHASLRGVVHRDVKPSNIVIDADGAVKLIDMGLARDFLQANGEVTQTNVTMGTLDYISPEQASDPRHVDIRSDIYSLGCTLYHALTGRPPFPEGTDLQKLLSHQSEKPPNPRDAAPELPEEFADLVMSMMAKKAIDRPQSPVELIHRMQETAAALNVAMPTSAPALPPPPKEAWWQQQLLWWGPTLLLLISVFIYSMIPTERDPDPTWNRAAATTNTAATETKDRQQKATETTKRMGVGPVVFVAENGDLAAAVKDAPEGATLQLAGDEYPLAAAVEGDLLRGLLVTKNLAIEPVSDHGRVRIRFNPASVSMSAAKDSLALVQVRSARLRLTRIWIEPGVRDRGCVGVRVDQGELELRDCLFDRSIDAMSPATAGTAAIAVNGGVVAALDSRFIAGDNLLKTSGSPAVIHFWNSLVGPYKRTFIFDAKTDVQVKHSAFLAGGEAVFTLNNPANVAMNVEHSIFAAAPGSPTTTLIESPKNQPFAATLWKGSGNLYAAGFARRISSNDRTLVEDVEKMRGWNFIDDAAQRIAEWPWTPTWETLANPFDDDENWRPQLALKEGVAAPTSDGLPVGINPGAAPSPVVEEPNAKKRTARPTPNNDAARTRNGGLTVDPSQTTSEATGVFATLEEAVRRAPDGKSTAILLAKSGGEIRERNVKIVGKTIVLRTADRRTLRLAEPKDMEIGLGAMFDVGEGGKLEFDGVQIEAFASRNDAAGAAFVRCSAGGVVEAVDSTFRISQGQGAQAMVFFRPTNIGANEGSSAPMLHLRRCDVRGAGPLLAAEPRQPWSFDAVASRLGSEAALLRLSGASMRTADSSANAVKFRQCAVLLGGSLLHLEPTGDAFGEPAATPIQFDVETTILAATSSASSTTPLLDVSTPMGSRIGADLAGTIKWKGDWNIVSGFASMMRVPDVDRIAGASPTAPRNVAFSEWVDANRLSASRQHYQSSRAVVVRSVWDVGFPSGKDWLREFSNLPTAFADEPSFEALP
jgi:serine/threonine protein kinase